MIEALCVEAQRRLEQAFGLPPRELSDEVDDAERAVVGVRDALISRLRAEPDETRWRAALDHANVALSLVVSVEYPAEGVQREPLRLARDELQHLRDGLKR